MLGQRLCLRQLVAFFFSIGLNLVAALRQLTLFRVTPAVYYCGSSAARLCGRSLGCCDLLCLGSYPQPFISPGATNSMPKVIGQRLTISLRVRASGGWGGQAGCIQGWQVLGDKSIHKTSQLQRKKKTAQNSKYARTKKKPYCIAV